MIKTDENGFEYFDAGTEVYVRGSELKWTVVRYQPDTLIASYRLVNSSKVERTEAVFNVQAAFEREYELAKGIGDARFGSECKHSAVANGKCKHCGRTVL